MAKGEAESQVEAVPKCHSLEAGRLGGGDFLEPGRGEDELG